MDRRTLLKLLSALGVAPLVRAPALAAETAAKGVFVLIDGAGSGVSAEQLAAFCEPLAEEVIPMGLGLRGDDTPDAALARFIADLVLLRADLFEIVLRTEGLFDRKPYFQMRLAAQGMANIDRIYFGADRAVPRIVSLADRSPGVVRSLDALRAIGLRNVLNLTRRASPAASGPCDGDVVCLDGSMQISLPDGAAELRDWLGKTVAGKGDNVVVVISAADLGLHDPADIVVASRAIADEIVAAVQGDRAFVVPPQEHLNWYAGFYKPVLSVLLDHPPEDDVLASAAFSRLRNAFEASGLPYTQVLPGSLLGADSGEACLALAAGASSLEWKNALWAAGLPTCAVGTDEPDAAGEISDSGLEFMAETMRRGYPMLDDGGVLRWPVINAEDIATQDRAADLLVRLTADDYRDQVKMDAVLAALSDLATAGQTDLRPVSGFLSEIMPADPVFEKLRKARQAPRETAIATEMDETEKSLLLEDARSAWRYVIDNTDPGTLLCPGTVHHTGDGDYRYQALTMWDLGSLIRANLAAHELGFVSNTEFAVRIEALLDALPANRIGGAILPSALISTTRRGVLSNNFNVCDTGRLLSALADLDRYSLTKGAAAPIVQKWDLESVITDGHPYSITAGRRGDDYKSHCTHYISRAFGLWGVEMDSPYVVDTSGSRTDWQMRVLYSAAWIGAYGAEPLLLEATELGMSAPSELLADVLWSEQRRAWTADGQLYCVSEAPIDRPPWFVYSGLRLNDASDLWATKANNPDPAFATESFRKQTLLVNTKGAFLWAATRPGEHASRLLAFVRERARSDDGTLSPGVFVSTGKGMPGYADLNTQGVILNSAAYILRGRRPRGG